MDNDRQSILGRIDAIAPQLHEISTYLKDNPETAYEEVKACA